MTTSTSSHTLSFLELDLYFTNMFLYISLVSFTVCSQTGQRGDWTGNTNSCHG